MNKKALAILALTGIIGAINGCGTAATGAITPESIAVRIVARVVIGQLTGNVSLIQLVIATDTTSGATLTSLLTSKSMAANKMASSGTGFSLDLPVDSSYSLSFIDSSNIAVAVLRFPKGSAGTTLSTVFNVNTSALTGSSVIDLGTIDIPAGTGGAGTPITYVEALNNPLEQNDLDDDGMSDFDDDDDDNDGVPDELDNDDNDDGTPDEEEES